MNEMTEPATANVGDLIEHDLMPGFVMTVQETQPCEQSSNRYLPHSQYRITDPGGQEDWLCAFDVTRVGRGTPS